MLLLLHRRWGSGGQWQTVSKNDDDLAGVIVTMKLESFPSSPGIVVVKPNLCEVVHWWIAEIRI